MTPDETSQEIERIKGELSAATAMLGLALHLAGHGVATAAIRQKVIEAPVDPAIESNPDYLNWREGVERFKQRLLQRLPDEDL